VDFPIEVDGSAPVLAHHEIDIAAPLEAVWALHTDVDGWPAWQTDITAARLDGGAFAPGASFEWTGSGLRVTSVIYVVAPATRILWGGTADGTTGIHEWLFSETFDATRVVTIESFAGAPVEADAAGMQSLLAASLISWLGHLKETAEARWVAESGR
jgi:hypothetical protein